MTNFDVLKENIDKLINKIKKVNYKKILKNILDYIKSSYKSIISFILAITLSYSVITLDIKTKRPEKKEEPKKDKVEEVIDKVAEKINVDPNLYDSVGEKFYLKHYDSFNGGSDTGTDAGYVVEAKKDDKKLLVDATQYDKILLDGFDEIKDTFYYKYYDIYYGGKDNVDVKSNGYVTEVIIDNKKYLFDANDFSKLLLVDYESIGEPFYLKCYDTYYGGYDNINDKSNGYVVEIIKNGIRYLVDANDFSQVLIENYTSISTNEDKIIIEFTDGRVEEKDSKSLKSAKSLILKK